MEERPKYGLELRFKKFKGKTAQQVMFDPEGRDYLHWVQGKLRKGEMFDNIQRVLRKGEKVTVKAVCSRCKTETADFLVVQTRGEDHKYYWLTPDFCCTKCAALFSPGSQTTKLFPLKFSSVSAFGEKDERALFLEILRYALFGKLNFVVTKKRAYEFFKNIDL